MTQEAIVTRILEGGRAEVQVTRKSACGDSCAHCASKCNEALAKVLVTVDNPVGARPGDRVEVYSSSKKVLSIAALVYLVPVALFLAAVIVTASMGLGSGLCALFSVLAFLLGILLAVIYNKRVSARAELTHKIFKILE